MEQGNEPEKSAAVRAKQTIQRTAPTALQHLQPTPGLLLLAQILAGSLGLFDPAQADMYADSLTDIAGHGRGATRPPDAADDPAPRPPGRQ